MKKVIEILCLQKKINNKNIKINSKTILQSNVRETGIMAVTCKIKLEASKKKNE